MAYRDQVVDELKAETGRKDSKESFKQVSLPNYIRSLRDPGERFSGKAIAVVYAEGDIVDGEGEWGQVGGAAFAREFRKLREDDSVKAVVLRVNSPGGSATAAEAIEREIRLTRRVKPVVVSMGSYAASGGYWISAGSDRIFADPTTITGSIGVFGIQFDIQKLFNDHGITFDGVKTGKFADSLTITRPKTPEEMAILQRMVDWTYGQFIGKVAEGRRMTPAQVEAIAQGRVWSGEEARKIGLVDALGGLDRAVAYAAKQAGLAGGFRVVEFPRKEKPGGPAGGMGRPDRARGRPGRPPGWWRGLRRGSPPSLGRFAPSTILRAFMPACPWTSPSAEPPRFCPCLPISLIRDCPGHRHPRRGRRHPAGGRRGFHHPVPGRQCDRPHRSRACSASRRKTPGRSADGPRGAGAGPGRRRVRTGALTSRPYGRRCGPVLIRRSR